jgi:hypothetical protein
MVALDVVTSEGKELLCNKEQNADLFWAARGAGPGSTTQLSTYINCCTHFSIGYPAIVTSFYLEVRPSFSAMMSSTFMWPMSNYKTVMDWIVQVTIHRLCFLTTRLTTCYEDCTGMRRFHGGGCRWPSP